MAQIKIKRGLQEAVERLELAEGELAVALDTGNVYVGITSGKIHVNPTGGTADTAIQLNTARAFKISGDAAAQAVSFDGTEDVELNLQLNEMTGLVPGSYTKLSVDEKGRVVAGFDLAVEDLPSNIPAGNITGLGSAAAKDAGSAAGNVALIGENGKLDTAIIPALAITDTMPVDSEEEMLALDAEQGDVCIRSDVSRTYILKREPASILDNWAWLKTPDYVQYVHPKHTAKASGLYKVTVDDLGHVSDTAAVTKEDITGLGIPAQDTVYSLPASSASVRGGVKVGTGLSISGDVLSVGDIDGGTF